MLGITVGQVWEADVEKEGRGIGRREGQQVCVVGGEWEEERKQVSEKEGVKEVFGDGEEEEEEQGKRRAAKD